MIRKITQITIPVTTLMIIIFDIIVLKLGGGKATISNVIDAWSVTMAFIPSFVGILCGHLFTRNLFDRANWKYIALAIIFIFNSFAFAFINKQVGYGIQPIVWLLISIPLGIYFWPQQIKVTDVKHV